MITKQLNGYYDRLPVIGKLKFLVSARHPLMSIPEDKEYIRKNKETTAVKTILISLKVLKS